jgi:hypothetical protein
LHRAQQPHTVDIRKQDAMREYRSTTRAPQQSDKNPMRILQGVRRILAMTGQNDR